MTKTDSETHSFVWAMLTMLPAPKTEHQRSMNFLLKGGY